MGHVNRVPDQEVGRFRPCQPRPPPGDVAVDSAEVKDGFQAKAERAERPGGNRACLALARRLLKKSLHTLRELGEDDLLPA
jgi:hypothetical protein